MTAGPAAIIASTSAPGIPNRSTSSSSLIRAPNRLRSAATSSGSGSAASSAARGRSSTRSSTHGSTGAVGFPNVPSTYLITWSGTLS